MKTCIITGASKGIGRATAIRLSKNTDIENYVLVARDKKALSDTKAAMNSQKNIDTFSVDLLNYDTTVKLVEKIARKYESIDYLLNIAGFVDPQSLLETTVDNWEKTFRVNVGSVFLLTREVVKHMKRTGGKIINIASTAGMSARPGWLAYAASKAAIISMSNTLSEELKEYGIKVYCLSPGRCATDLRKLLAPQEDPATIMQPEDVAEFISGLVTTQGDFIDSQNIVIRKQIIG